MNIAEFFDLPVAAFQGTYNVLATANPYVLLAKSFSGAPAIIGRFPQASTALPKRLANVLYLPAQPVVINTSGHTEESLASVFACVAEDHDMWRYFLSATARTLIEDCSTQIDFDRHVEGILELFVRLALPARTSVQGVWAELLLICQARDTPAAIHAWHSDAAATFDFSSGQSKIEVKSSMTQRRQHHFALEQLRTSVEHPTVVASVLVEESQDGLAIWDLVERIASRCSTELRQQLELKIANELGVAWQESNETRFEYERALASLAFYQANDIPAVREPLPAGVSHITFVADLALAPVLESKDLGALAPFFAAFMPNELSTL